jgi:hypothetical protein
MRHLNVNGIALPLCLAIVLVSAGCRGERETGTTGTAGTSGTALKVTDVTLGRAIGADKAVTDSTDNFRPNDTIYASVATEGSAASTSLRALWTYQDGQVVNDSSHTIAPNNRERTEFHIAKPDGLPTGDYQVEIFVDGRSVEKKKFEVK